MQSRPEWRPLTAALTLSLVFPLAGVSAADSTRLKYLARYDHQPGVDHLMGVEAVLGHYALISSNLAVTLVDLDALTPDGTQSFIDRLESTDALSTVTRADGYVYINLRQSGLAVAYLDPITLELSFRSNMAEFGVYFEEMAVVGDRLYVAAHAYGIRIYDLTNPEAPTLVGSLEEGFDDAFAIAVAGQTAYVADGAGGLKIVDISNEATPRIIAGEDPTTAPGTAQDVLVINNHVYVAAGGAGVAVYPAGELAGRVLYDTRGSANELARVGEYLAVADLTGLTVFAIAPDGSLSPAARELAARRSRGGQWLTTRLWYGAAGWGDNRILAANWDTTDVYELVDPSQDDQPDITASTQRIRFAPGGGSTIVRVSNDGSGVLQATNIYATESTFSVQPSAAVLQPGEAVDLTIDYVGGQSGNALVWIESNDPDESPFPIQVFGETEHLDPGEPAIPFALEAWTFDHETREFSYETFDLAEHAGQVVYFRVFGLW